MIDYSEEPVQDLLNQLRAKFRRRDDHHHNCSSRKDRNKLCDCYMQSAEEAHQMIDELARRLGVKS